jgi:hypothetical protein
MNTIPMPRAINAFVRKSDINRPSRPCDESVRYTGASHRFNSAPPAITTSVLARMAPALSLQPLCLCGSAPALRSALGIVLEILGHIRMIGPQLRSPGPPRPVQTTPLLAPRHLEPRYIAAKLLRASATSGWSVPRSFSLIASARVKRRCASAYCPCFRCKTPRLFNMAATSR